MSVTNQQLREWMASGESEHLEFKEARNRYDFEELVRYCCALANEGGGRIVLGVSDQAPRRVVGTSAFEDINRTKFDLVDRLRLRIEAEALAHPDGRVVVFTVPPRPIGWPIEHKGAHWMRAGESLTPMTNDMLKAIFNEAGPDFSAEICRKAGFDDLDPDGIKRFRLLWKRKSQNEALDRMSDEQLLGDAELIVDGEVTYAALILLGTSQALGRRLGQAEVVFEYRSQDGATRYQQRKQFRQGFFLFQDDLWQTINLRNDVQHCQEGFFVWDIPTFSEAVVREAVLNAVSHRDYRLPGSIFIRQCPRRLEVVSPGGFPPGITVENMLDRQSPRNRRIAETLARSGMVERSGQGLNLMFESCIKESKRVPDFAGTDEFQVALTLYGDVQDRRFLAFLEEVGKETLASFSAQDLVILDRIHRDQPLDRWHRSRLQALAERGIIERVGRRRGVRHLLSRRFYSFIGEKGAYTRRRGLDRATNKELLFKHIRDNRREGSRFHEFSQALPNLSRFEIQSLVKELRSEGRIHATGRTKGARWFPGPPQGQGENNLN